MPTCKRRPTETPCGTWFACVGEFPTLRLLDNWTIETRSSSGLWVILESALRAQVATSFPVFMIGDTDYEVEFGHFQCSYKTRGATLRSILILGLFILFGFVPALAQEEKPITVSVCDLKNNPDAYNHKLVQLQGGISHEFEDFSIRNAGCPDFKNTPWLMYGGNAQNDVTYCCGVTTGSKDRVNIEGIEVPLRREPLYERFRKLLSSYRFDQKAKVHHIESDPSYSVTATVVGRFFAGKQGAIGRGFGHMGCCTLLAIEQVVSIDKVSSNLKPGELSCYTEGWKERAGDENVLASKLNELHKSDEPWRKRDARRVATEALKSYLKGTKPSLEFKGCKTKHLAYDEKKNDQYLTACRWISAPLDSYAVEVMKYHFLKNPLNTWNGISWMPYKLSHQHCSESSDPE